MGYRLLATDSGSFDVHEGTGIVLKFLLAGDGAEIEILAVILAVAGGVLLVDFHSANWIDRHGGLLLRYSDEHGAMRVVARKI